ncbi:HsdR family type I site-specific deoxyribonuclease [Nocardia sp. NBC_00565]|uniref:HsdR family type I site-specific deoxyribonuclease n=1 Tax=Nocardia sp. NBC_00565 TaxID=2975993 RepID=UPI002E7FF3E1|nr:HsdR family type I site-specific deoxyribonuclease [Nocardia sp. NBC_00565]WUC00353.1 HsdR family type I site-specific deoxyribonuclease [Nocardia sp. NBC_00565]
MSADRTFRATDHAVQIHVDGDGHVGALHISSHRGAVIPTVGRFVVGEIPREPVAFVRRETIRLLEEHLEGSPRALVAALAGMRGIGKTHVAAAHARQVQERGGSVLWINAATARDILAGLSRAAVLLGISELDGDLEKTLDQLWNCIAQLPDPKLVVFDNAQDPDLVHRHLPRDPNTRVVITSTDHRFHELAPLIPVDVYTREESIEYLNQRTAIKDQPGASAVAEELGNLPLAIAAAASVIRNDHFTYDEYLQLLRQPNSLDEALKKAAGQHYPDAVTVALQLNLDTVRAQSIDGGATVVLGVVAALDSNGAATELLARLAITSVKSVISQCVNSSALTFSRDEHSVTMHSLFRRMVQRDAERSGLVPTIATFAHDILQPELIGNSGEVWKRRIGVSIAASHVESLWSWANSHMSHADNGNILRLLLHQRACTVSQLTAIAELTEAIRIGSMLLSDYVRVLGPEHPDTLASRENLATTYRLAGRVDDAIELLERAVADKERILGLGHPDILTPRSDLALAYESAGRLSEATLLLEQTLIENESVLGPEDPETLRVRGDLAFTYRSAGRLPEAIRLFEQTVTENERVFGSDDPETLATRDNLAGAYELAGRTAESIRLFKQTLADRHRVLGSDHPHTLMSRHNLAYAYRSAGKFDDAIENFERTLADQEQLLGADHLHALMSRQHLADAYFSAGRLHDAITHYRRSIADCERLLGSDHSDTLHLRRRLAKALGAGPNLASSLAEVFGALSWEPEAGMNVSTENSGRESLEELIIPSLLRASIRRLNPYLPTHVADSVLDLILTPRSQDLATENARIHDYLVNGIRETTYFDEFGIERSPTVHIVDRLDIKSNSFLALREVVVQSQEGIYTLDAVLYVNGIPLAVVEMKKSAATDSSVESAYSQLQHYLECAPPTFRFSMMFLVSDGVQARYGTAGSPYSRFASWNVDDVGRPISQPGTAWDDSELSLALRGIFDKHRLIDLICSFSIADRGGGGQPSRIARPHQYFAVLNAINRTVEAMSNDGRAGVVWHTPGSGISTTIEMFVNQALRNPALAAPTVVVINDRSILSDQLFKIFLDDNLIPDMPMQVSTRQELRTELTNRRVGGVLFTTLQKFSRTEDEIRAGLAHPLLSDRKDIIVVANEGHRSHSNELYGYARHLRDALPNATMIAFTGTPVNQNDRDTRAVFGEYIDIYDIGRAVRDGATVPIYYESRLIPVNLPSNVEQPEDIELEDMPVFNVVYGAPDRLRRLASDIVEHWEKRSAAMTKVIGVAGKAVVVCSTREICASLYSEIVSLRMDWHDDRPGSGIVKVLYSTSSRDSGRLLRYRLSAAEQNMIRLRFKNPRDSLELVIVTEITTVGFDAPSLHTLYVDRPMRGAPLMQALSRINRVFEDKSDGLIVAYTPLADQLQEVVESYTETAGQNASAEVQLRDRQSRGLSSPQTAAYRWQSLCRVRTSLANDIDQ